MGDREDALRAVKWTLQRTEYAKVRQMLTYAPPVELSSYEMSHWIKRFQEVGLVEPWSSTNSATTWKIDPDHPLLATVALREDTDDDE